MLTTKFLWRLQILCLILSNQLSFLLEKLLKTLIDYQNSWQLSLFWSTNRLTIATLVRSVEIVGLEDTFCRKHLYSWTPECVTFCWIHTMNKSKKKGLTQAWPEKMCDRCEKVELMCQSDTCHQQLLADDVKVPSIYIQKLKALYV